MPAEPKISVLMPAYNAEAHIQEAIDSILAQTEPDFEFLILDDGSTDDTAAIVETAAAKDQRIVASVLPHSGLVSTLNEGIARARGEFIARMDADDVARLTRFARQLAHMRAHPECIAVGSFIQRFGSLRTVGVVPERQTYAPGVRQDVAIFHPTAFVRTAPLRISGGYRSTFEYAEDSELWRRLIRQGEIHNLGEILLDYRHHNKQSSRQHSALQALRNNVAVSLYASAGEIPSLEPSPLEPSTITRLSQSHPERAVRSNLLLDVAEYHLTLVELAPYLAAMARVASSFPTARLGSHARLLARQFLRPIFRR